MIVPMLREMRAEKAALHEQTRELIAALDTRLGAEETAQTRYQLALSADTLLSKPATGEFEQRIALRERKMRDVERRF
jgi:hypothetical protein